MRFYIETIDHTEEFPKVGPTKIQIHENNSIQSIEEWHIQRETQINIMH